MRVMNKAWAIAGGVMIIASLCSLSMSAAQQPASPDANVAAPVNAAPPATDAPTSNPPPNAAAVNVVPADATVVHAMPGGEASAGETLAQGDGSKRAVSANTLPQNLSPWGMFMQAHVVVKVVMIGLALASLLTWTVWLAKAIELRHASQRLRRGISQILSAATLREALSSFDAVDDTSAVLVREAADELRVSARVLDHLDHNGVNERVTSRLSRVETEAGQRMTRGTGVLATIGATAPFVGLFGTVWGIMNSFIGISQSQTTNLAVVAPGIAEALLATALGLVAAIPAVIIYNVFARSIAGYRRLLGDASAGIERLVSRELDFRKLPSSLSRAAE